MKKLIVVACLPLVVLLFYRGIPGKAVDTTKTNTPDVEWLQHWLGAWELTSAEIFKLPEQPVPMMLFFDSSFVYTNSPVSAPTGIPFSGPKLFGKPVAWRKAPHNGTVIMPDGQKAPVGIISFAAPLSNDSAGSFFAMAAPDIWQAGGIESKELGLSNLLTAVFLHEFSHTRQVHTYGAMVSELEKQYKLEKELNDNIVQAFFGKDSLFVKAYKKEIHKLYAGALCLHTACKKQAALEATRIFRNRQKKYFVNERAILKQLDDIFLTMEGCGQYAGVAWLMHPGGGGLPAATAVEGFRRDRSQWSQDEGLGMFLLLQALAAPNWARDFFGPEPKLIPHVLQQAARK